MMDADNEKKESLAGVPVKDETASVDSEVKGKKTNEPKKGKAGSIIIKILILCILAYIGYDIVKRVKLLKNKPAVVEERIYPVKTELVKSIGGTFEMQYAGTTRAIRQVDIGFNVSGTLNKLPINSGMTLEKNAVIGELDPRDFQNDLNAATASYTNAQARLARVQKLYDAQVDPKSKLDTAIALFKVAEADLEIAQKARNDTILKAPFKGIIAVRYVDNYQVVSQGQPIISLQDLETLEVQADIPEWLVARATSAEEIDIYATYEALPGVKIPLKIKEFAAQASSSTRTYVMRFFMATNPTDSKVTILPGMTANIVMSIKPKEGEQKQFMLPVWAVNSNAGKNKPAVFVVDDTVTPWIVKRRDVRAGELTGETIIINGSLKDGERVVIAGATRLKDGTKVKDLPDFVKSNIAELNDAKAADRKKTRTDSAAYAPEVK